jgi:hypothetical protein
VHAQLALSLAAEIDDPAVPSYVRPRLVSELRAILLEIEDRQPPAGPVNVRALLREVARG